MYNSLINWIGSKTCTAAGDISSLLDVNYGCASGQALNMGLIVLGFLAFSVLVITINARRRQRRDND
ncbi:MAG: hypothetical protein SGI91_24065 [Alphaproteobacteria bacterium]|jgi:hypothetical protein|nr:hypothetical protein [Alphaproteobacteria bacterium]